MLEEERLGKECEEIIRLLMSKHEFLQPSNPHHDIWDAEDAKTVLADLIQLIGESYEIELAHSKRDWGK